MPFTVEDDLAQAAHLSDLTPEQTRLALAVGLFAEDHLSLAQAAIVARQDLASFQHHLTLRGITIVGDKDSSDANPGLPHRGRPWLALRNSALFVGDPFAPAVSEDEIVALQQPDVDADS